MAVFMRLYITISYCKRQLCPSIYFAIIYPSFLIEISNFQPGKLISKRGFTTYTRGQAISSRQISPPLCAIQIISARSHKWQDKQYGPRPVKRRSRQQLSFEHVVSSICLFTISWSSGQYYGHYDAYEWTLPYKEGRGSPQATDQCHYDTSMGNRSALVSGQPNSRSDHRKRYLEW